MKTALVCFVVAAAPGEPNAEASAVPLHPGEKLLEELPAFESTGSETGEPFGVVVPLAVGDFQLLRVIVRTERDVFAPGAAVTLTLTGPDGFTRKKEFRYFNAVVDDTIQDPMSYPVPVGPNAGAGTLEPRTRREPGTSSVGGPVMGFETNEMGRPGVYDVAIEVAGRGTVHRRTRLVRHLGENFRLHQWRQFDDWLMETRAAIQSERFVGFGGVIQRATFRQGRRTVEVDIMDVPGVHSYSARTTQLFEHGEWHDAPSVEVKLRRQQIKLRRHGQAFEAAWPTSDRVIFIRGDRYGGPEKKVIELYLGFYDSHW